LGHVGTERHLSQAFSWSACTPWPWRLDGGIPTKISPRSVHHVWIHQPTVEQQNTRKLSCGDRKHLHIAALGRWAARIWPVVTHRSSRTYIFRPLRTGIDIQANDLPMPRATRRTNDWPMFLDSMITVSRCTHSRVFGHNSTPLSLWIGAFPRITFHARFDDFARIVNHNIRLVCPQYVYHHLMMEGFGRTSALLKGRKSESSGEPGMSKRVV